MCRAMFTFIRCLSVGVVQPRKYVVATNLTGSSSKQTSLVVRAMDNVSTNDLPVEEQKTEAKNKRRMGLGVTGLPTQVNCWGCLATREFVVGEDVLKMLRDERTLPRHYLPKRGFIRSTTLRSILLDGLLRNTKKVRDSSQSMGYATHLTSIARRDYQFDC